MNENGNNFCKNIDLRNSLNFLNDKFIINLEKLRLSSIHINLKRIEVIYSTLIKIDLGTYCFIKENVKLSGTFTYACYAHLD